jgi:hypothetical protein
MPLSGVHCDRLRLEVLIRAGLERFAERLCLSAKPSGISKDKKLKADG